MTAPHIVEPAAPYLTKPLSEASPDLMRRLLQTGRSPRTTEEPDMKKVIDPVLLHQ